MPIATSYPGVYIEETSGAGRPIPGVATSITAFVGQTLQGPLDQPVHVGGFSEFAQSFGGLASGAPLSYAVAQFFQNGGTDAVIVRVGEDDAAVSDPALAAAKRGIWALDTTDLFNLLCILPPAFGKDISRTTRDAAASYCAKRRALFLVDPPIAWARSSDVISGLAELMARSASAALFFPSIRAADPALKGQLRAFAPCGAIAGLFARTDAARGVWTFPAGLDAMLSGIAEPSVQLSDGDSRQLNPLAVNCLRTFPKSGTVVWGSRTLAGADQLASDWKYIPVRRLALFIEESLDRGTRWVVNEPNDESLWAQLRRDVGVFLHDLFRRGAFQGRTPNEAYFVKCDTTTTTPADIDLGVVTILVGFAALKPGEFVIIRLQQAAAKAEGSPS